MLYRLSIESIERRYNALKKYRRVAGGPEPDVSPPASKLYRRGTGRRRLRLRGIVESVRVMARGPSFESQLNETFDPIRQNAKGVCALAHRRWPVNTVGFFA